MCDNLSHMHSNMTQLQNGLYQYTSYWEYLKFNLPTDLNMSTFYFLPINMYFKFCIELYLLATIILVQYNFALNHNAIIHSCRRCHHHHCNWKDEELTWMRGSFQHCSTAHSPTWPQLQSLLIYACNSLLKTIAFTCQIRTYLKKFHMPRRIISRHEINVIIATLWRGRQSNSSTNCIHESLRTTFTTCDLADSLLI